ncbi:MAG: anthranilate synthase component I [Lachnospiraceae bacterium]|nr:anthranilate synthase component I [Lachnospiraceae bacterium]
MKAVYTPTMEDITQYLGRYHYVPVKREIFSDICTPIQALKRLKAVSDHVFMLESVEEQENWGRYTFLGFNPRQCLTCTDGHMTVTKDNGDIVDDLTLRHPSRYIREIIEEYKSPRLDDFPSFTGGLVGYFAYDYIKYSEPKLDLNVDDEEHFKDVDLMLFDKVIAFDNVKQKIVIVANVDIRDKTMNLKPRSADSAFDAEDMARINDAYDKALKDIDEIADILISGKEVKVDPGRLTSQYRALFDKETYCDMVKKAKNYIYEGDIFQVVLSNRLDADYEGSLLDTYRMLRTINPSPYMFYFSGDDIEVAGASPETLVKLHNGVLHTYPLAGTRKRGRDEEEDKALEEELLADEKERAEHNMLVDLGRNDIGRISDFGSVEVEKYMAIERFSHVMHIGSTVRGKLRGGLTQLDAIDSILPAGTLSGAPKVRACEIIAELEKNKRGIYGGAIGYIDFMGNLDTCIAIRIAYKKNGKVFVRSGAGIVADSVPENEYEECLNKAKAVMSAIEKAQEMA